MPGRVLILGGSGLLGRSLIRNVPPGIDLLHPTHAELPLEEPDRIDALLERGAIDRVILTAAWTQVDDCESDPDRAIRINGILPGAVARRAAQRGIGVVYLSTDYVFDGAGPSRPRLEYDSANPISVYGQSKWYGECAVREAGGEARIVRTSGLYGLGGPDFVGSMIPRLRKGPVRVVKDQVLNPTCVEDLAPALWILTMGNETGTFHLTARGGVSWFEFTRAIAREIGTDPDEVTPIRSEEFARPAPRPLYSVLDCGRARELYGIELPTWDVGLRRHLSEASAADGPP